MYDWGKSSVSKDEYYHMISMLSIKNDCETIKALMLNNNHPIVSMGLVSYFSMFCVEVEKYYNDILDYSIKIKNDSVYNLNAARTQLKLFNGRYGRAARHIIELDNMSDEFFKKSVRYRFIQNNNLYYNLGIYFNNDREIIGDTQFFWSLFQEDKKPGTEILGDEVFKFGIAMGTVVSSISLGLEDSLPAFCPQIIRIENKYYYKDLNTNKTPIFYSDFGHSKEKSLLLLHVLGNINFALYIVGAMLHDNQWKLRIQYITMYYAYLSINNMCKNTKDMALSQIWKDATNNFFPIFDTRFRSCLMHYSFINKGIYLIEDQYIDYSTPFYGLVESCFDGKSYDSLQQDIICNLKIMADTIKHFCAIDLNKIKPLD